MSAPPAIRIDSLTKVYAAPRGVRDLVLHPLRPPGRLLALDAVSLEVGRGEVLGLLGPNGAGKTTLLKLLACLVLPTSGSARVNGFSIEGQERQVRSSIGYVTSDERSFYWRLSGRENLRFFARLYGLGGAALGRRCAELFDKVGLEEAAEERFMNYSSGMRQKLAVARALLHDPPVLFMDEPTRSLDPLSARHLRAFVREVLVGVDGKTILLATHNLREAEEVCTRVGILVRARLRRTGSVEELRRWAGGGETYRLDVDGIGKEALPAGCRALSCEPGRLRLEATLAGEDVLDPVLRRLQSAGGRILRCEKVEASLEEAFGRICAESEREDTAVRGGGDPEPGGEARHGTVPAGGA